MATYVFASPILPGKTEDFRKYVREVVNGPHWDQYVASNRRNRLDVEQVWLQHTPQGDFVLVRWEVDDPARIFEHAMESDDPFDQWFREKILIECLGVDPSHPQPSINEQLVDYQGLPTKEKAYSGTRNR
jgi:hypothetical protein